MLDIHATTGTPGATTAIANNLTAIAANDGATVAGVPINPRARLIMWGSQSLVANTIYYTRLQSQDQDDPLNGDIVNLGTTSLVNSFNKYVNLPYKTGARNIGQTTNTAQTGTSIGFTLDYYDSPTGIAGSRFMDKQRSILQTLAADVAISWTATAFAPAIAIPNGRYAILGAYIAVTTDPHIIRFAHSDFGGFKPGFPIIDTGEDAIHGFQKGVKDELQCEPGFQFVKLSEFTRMPCVPTFTVSNAGTGLNIECIASSATNTPQLTLNLARVS